MFKEGQRYKFYKIGALGLKERKWVNAVVELFHRTDGSCGSGCISRTCLESTAAMWNHSR